ncbi:molybdenum cofactor biosynthesis protein MoaE [Limibaculum sp. FT325]|uniref:molybdenum cofactor biosynthesis protein MoaE n=1 Tax=Thermohalobaculum sediminis TaxID=2939436 RepID=UPI0020BEFEB2|nr:molybdenum cofactor biosynthesis protein MoaE [Limibaculum sediminis]MCL5777101.1 molybdenum cofactor biosynthesis protein MoaE [Limibaculum sediminis]
MADGAGARPQVSVQREDFDIAAEIEALTAGNRDIGAVVSFTGLVREMTGEGAIAAMELEHWPGGTENALGKIVAEAEARWPLDGVRVIHRYGPMAPGERIVLVLAASRHRAAAFEAAAFLMDYLKTRAPFWKKEHGPGGGRWVDARECDDAAAERWRDGRRG